MQFFLKKIRLSKKNTPNPKWQILHYTKSLKTQKIHVTLWQQSLEQQFTYPATFKEIFPFQLPVPISSIFGKRLISEQKSKKTSELN